MLYVLYVSIDKIGSANSAMMNGVNILLQNFFITCIFYVIYDIFIYL